MLRELHYWLLATLVWSLAIMTVIGFTSFIAVMFIVAARFWYGVLT